MLEAGEWPETKSLSSGSWWERHSTLLLHDALKDKTLVGNDENDILHILFHDAFKIPRLSSGLCDENNILLHDALKDQHFQHILSRCFKRLSPSGHDEIGILHILLHDALKVNV